MLHQDTPALLHGSFRRAVATANIVGPDMHGAKQGRPITFPEPAANIANRQESYGSSRDQEQCQVGKSTKYHCPKHISSGTLIAQPLTLLPAMDLANAVAAAKLQ